MKTYTVTYTDEGTYPGSYEEAVDMVRNNTEKFQNMPIYEKNRIRRTASEYTKCIKGYSDAILEEVHSQQPGPEGRRINCL